MTVEELYAAYMDDEKSFAEDVYGWFGGDLTGLSTEKWESQYGMYLPTYDPAQVKLAGRTRDLDYRKARDILDISTKAADRVYATEADTISTGLGTEIAKGKAISGTLGLRSGSLEGALEDTMTIASNKIENLGDRALIQTEEDKNTYNAAMVDSALDFEKTEREEKEEFYDRTMAAIMRLSDIDAFHALPCGELGKVSCITGGCADSEEQCPGDACGTPNGSVTDPMECQGGAPNTTIDGTTLTATCEYGSCDFTAGCQQVCTAAGAGMYEGGIAVCIQDCTGAMAGGAGTWGGGQWVLEEMQIIENELNCPGGGGWEAVGDTFEYVCAGGGDDDYDNPCAGVIGSCNFNPVEGRWVDAFGNDCPEGC